MTVNTLKIYQENEEDASGEKDPGQLTPEQKENLLKVRVGRVVRLALLLAIGGWVMSLWGTLQPWAGASPDNLPAEGTLNRGISSPCPSSAPPWETGPSTSHRVAMLRDSWDSLHSW